MATSGSENTLPLDQRELPKRTRVLVIGGGVVGCSVLYHLAKLGETNIVLVEKNQLTSGSSWHAAGMLSQYHADRVHLEIIKEGRALYGEFEKNPDTAVGLHSSGDLKLARSEHEMLDLKRWIGIAKTLGVSAEIVDAARLKELYPIMEVEGILGALWFPTAGYVDPSLTTHSLARQARGMGARVFQECAVEAIKRNQDKSWLVVTSKGTIQADYIVNCAGVWAAEISAMIGEIIPSMGVEHQMMVFETIPEVKALGFELPMVHDPATPLYTRADRDGLIVSSYSDHTLFFGAGGVPKDFAGELLPPEVDRGESKLAVAMETFPALQNVGVRAFVNGAIPRSADRVPLVGPAHGYDNYFLSCSNYGGFLFVALGRYLAEWLLHGESSINLVQMDPRRFDEYADDIFAIRKMEGVTSGHTGPQAGITVPTAIGAGAVWTSPVYGLLKAKQAVFETVGGWEVPKWFARAGDDTKELPAFVTPNWIGAIGDERDALLNSVGTMDLTSLGKFEVTGEGADGYMEQRLTVDPPALNEMVYAPALNRTGGLVGLWRVSRPRAGAYYVTSDSRLTRRELDSLRWESSDEVVISDRTRDRAVLGLGGPKAVDVLAKLGWRSGGGGTALPSGAEDGRIGFVPTTLVRVPYGEMLLWELHTRMEYQAGLYERLVDAGAEFGIKDVGSRALTAIRTEAGLPLLGTDINYGADPRDVGIGELLSLCKPCFVGKQSLMWRSSNGLKLVKFKIDVASTKLSVAPTGDEPVLSGETCIGYVTSATSTYGGGTVLGFALVDSQADTTKSDIAIEILEVPYKAEIVRVDLRHLKTARVKQGG
ncbi:MAG: FAD-dependent oxidoreductase [Mesorhizobium sp.]|nr:MAG: FAD-dependent oxidoreductase [Mesorhizobium sp.]